MHSPNNGFHHYVVRVLFALAVDVLENDPNEAHNGHQKRTKGDRAKVIANTKRKRAKQSEEGNFVLVKGPIVRGKGTRQGDVT